MPPKRKQAAASASSKPASKRQSKLAKEHDVTAEEEAEIQESFNLFAFDTPDHDGKELVIETKDVRRCLIALNCPPSSGEELKELVEIADSEGTGYVTYAHFMPVAALKLNQRKGDPDALNEEVVKAYMLFTKGQEREITIQDLRRVAKELREDVPENVLKDMIREATSGGLGSVGMEDFENVMRRAGVFG